MSTIRTIGIRGAGLAGLTIARELLRLQSDISITLFELRPRLPHPLRTFCFFDTDRTLCLPCPSVTWSAVSFRGRSFERRLDVHETPYTMIRGDDFYGPIVQELESSGVSFHWSCASVDIEGETICAGHERHTFDCVIDAAFQPSCARSRLWQSFAGIWIETPTAAFDPTTAILMDLQESSPSAPVNFLYILPTSSTSALVEHTSFSPTPVPHEHHLTQCHQWLQQRIGNTGVIRGYEHGLVPMGLVTPPRVAPYVVGSNAGAIRPATGYAFLATQRQARLLSEQILRGTTRSALMYPYWLRLGDALFLQALKNAPTQGGLFLERLLSRSPARALVAFLSGNSTPYQAISVWFAVSKLAMLKALASRVSPGLVTVSALFCSLAMCALVSPEVAEWLALMLMIIAGIPHGSFDLRVAKVKWHSAAASPVRTVACYVACVVLMSSLCIFTPLLGLSLFLLISSLHFTEGESQSTTRVDNVRGALYGAGAIVLPIGLHPREAAAYVHYFVSPALFGALVPFLTGTAFVLAGSIGILLMYDLRQKRALATTLERALCLLAWILLPPLAGFAVWFIGRHSRQHLALCHTMFRSSTSGIPFDFLLLSLLAILGLSPFMLMFDFSDINQLFAAAICLIAGLTLPHMIVSHGLVARHKRT